MAENEASPSALRLSPANDLWDGICARPLRYNPARLSWAFDQGIETRNKRGRSAKPGKNLAIKSRNSIWKIHLPNGDKLYKVLGPHAPNLTANEVNLLQPPVAAFSDAVAPLEMHHHDVVHFALEEVQKEIDEGQRRQSCLPLARASRSQSEKKAPKT